MSSERPLLMSFTLPHSKVRKQLTTTRTQFVDSGYLRHEILNLLRLALSFSWVLNTCSRKVIHSLSNTETQAAPRY